MNSPRKGYLPFQEFLLPYTASTESSSFHQSLLFLLYFQNRFTPNASLKCSYCFPFFNHFTSFSPSLISLFFLFTSLSLIIFLFLSSYIYPLFSLSLFSATPCSLSLLWYSSSSLSLSSLTSFSLVFSLYIYIYNSGLKFPIKMNFFSYQRGGYMCIMWESNWLDRKQTVTVIM